jgi:hypothetical protein
LMRGLAHDSIGSSGSPSSATLGPTCPFLRAKGSEAQGRYIERATVISPRGRDGGIPPLSFGRYREKLARHHLGEPGGPEGQGALHSLDATRDRGPFDGKDDEVDILAHIDIVLGGLGSFHQGEPGIGVDAEPRAVGGHIVGSL